MSVYVLPKHVYSLCCTHAVPKNVDIYVLTNVSLPCSQLCYPKTNKYIYLTQFTFRQKYEKWKNAKDEK